MPRSLLIAAMRQSEAGDHSSGQIHSPALLFKAAAEQQTTAVGLIDALFFGGREYRRGKEAPCTIHCGILDLVFPSRSWSW